MKRPGSFIPDLTVNANYDATGIGAQAMARTMFTAMTKRLGCTYNGHKGSVDSDVELKDLVPQGMTVYRHHGSRWGEAMLITGEDVAIYLDYTTGSSFQIAVASKTMARSKSLVKEIQAKIPVKVIADNSVSINMWQLGQMGPVSKYKKIEAPLWEEVERNYADRTMEPLKEIMKVSKPEGNGKILLWYGAPGTGKTSAIRTLMREWKPWCEFHYVADPEKLFANPNYLMEVGMGDSSNNWRLVIAEDTDEFLRANARRESGAALGRLLNFADGILGQGSNTIFLLTTNEPIEKLHTALIRPGRCLAQVEFDKFSPEEVERWLPSDVASPTDPKTLAELVAYRDETKVITTKTPDKPFGFR